MIESNASEASMCEGMDLMRRIEMIDASDLGAGVAAALLDSRG